MSRVVPEGTAMLLRTMVAQFFLDLIADAALLKVQPELAVPSVKVAAEVVAGAAAATGSGEAAGSGEATGSV